MSVAVGCPHWWRTVNELTVPLNTREFPAPRSPPRAGFLLAGALPIGTCTTTPRRATTGSNQSTGTYSYALQQENRLRVELVVQVQAAHNGGAIFDELAVLVERLEVVQP